MAGLGLRTPGHAFQPQWPWDLLIPLAIGHIDLQFHPLPPYKYPLKELSLCLPSRVWHWCLYALEISRHFQKTVVQLLILELWAFAF